MRADLPRADDYCLTASALYLLSKQSGHLVDSDGTMQLAKASLGTGEPVDVPLPTLSAPFGGVGVHIACSSYDLFITSSADDSGEFPIPRLDRFDGTSWATAANLVPADVTLAPTMLVVSDDRGAVFQRSSADGKHAKPTASGGSVYVGGHPAVTTGGTMAWRGGTNDLLFETAGGSGGAAGSAPARSATQVTIWTEPPALRLHQAPVPRRATSARVGSDPYRCWYTGDRAGSGRTVTMVGGDSAWQKS